MTRRFEPTPPWTTFEVILRNSGGELTADCERPFSQELKSGGDRLETALGKMWLVGRHGWPEAIAALRDKKGDSLIDRADDEEPPIWILKCKPSCWRLYFHVYQARNRIVYLHAKCKKQTPRDPADSAYARRILEGLRPGGSGIIEFEFPSG